jgi:hypothetical protein
MSGGKGLKTEQDRARTPAADREKRPSGVAPADPARDAALAAGDPGESTPVLDAAAAAFTPGEPLPIALEGGEVVDFAPDSTERAVERGDPLPIDVGGGKVVTFEGPEGAGGSGGSGDGPDAVALENKKLVLRGKENEAELGMAGQGGEVEYRHRSDELEVDVNAKGGAEGGGHGRLEGRVDTGDTEAHLSGEYRHGRGDPSVKASAGVTAPAGDGSFSVGLSGGGTMDGDKMEANADMMVTQAELNAGLRAGVDKQPDGMGGEGEVSVRTKQGGVTLEGKGRRTGEDHQGSGALTGELGDKTLTLEGDGSTAHGGQGGGAAEVKVGDRWSAKVSGRLSRQGEETTRIKAAAGGHVDDTSGSIHYEKGSGGDLSVQEVGIVLAQKGISLEELGELGLGVQGTVEIDDNGDDRFDVSTELTVVKGDSKLTVKVRGARTTEDELGRTTGMGGGDAETTVGLAEAEVTYESGSFRNRTRAAAGGNADGGQYHVENETTFGENGEHTIELATGGTLKGGEFSQYLKSTYDVLHENGHTTGIEGTVTVKPGDDGYEQLFAMHLKYGIPVSSDATLTFEVRVEGGSDRPVAFYAAIEATYKQYYVRVYGKMDTKGKGHGGLAIGDRATGISGVLQGGNDDHMQHIDPRIADEIGGSVIIGIEIAIPGT